MSGLSNCSRHTVLMIKVLQNGPRLDQVMCRLVWLRNGDYVDAVDHAMPWNIIVTIAGVHMECRSVPNFPGHFYEGDNDYGHVEVREGAHLFWWLYYAGGDKMTAFAEKPLIIWLQGGPGIPASGLGNFQEIGPQDIYHQNRTTSWVHKRNVLFIDSPVGTGFSYVTNDSLFVTSDDQYANDLVVMIKQFMEKYPRFRTVPTYIFSQGYESKIAPRFAYYLYRDTEEAILKGNKESNINLKSVVLGSPFTSPKDTIDAHAAYIYNLGLINAEQYKVLHNYSLEIEKAIETGNYVKAADLRTEQFDKTPGADKLFGSFNIFKTERYSIEFEDWFTFMNTTVRNNLSTVVPQNVPPYLHTFPNIVVNLKGSLIKPATDMVEKLLNSTNINIVIYNGLLDFTAPPAGTLAWVERLNCIGSEEFKDAERKPIPGNLGLYKRTDRLSFWWIFNAGQSVTDNPAAMEYLLNEVVDSTPQVTDNPAAMEYLLNEVVDSTPQTGDELSATTQKSVSSAGAEDKLSATTQESDSSEGERLE